MGPLVPVEVFLGLDCGGSKTRAVALDTDGNVVFEGSSGPANWATTLREEIKLHLSEATKGLVGVSSVCGCFAGLLTDQDRADAEAMLASLFPDAKVCARPDYHAALAACPPETTVCVIAGTGSMVCSWYKGEVVKSGGGGPLFGDHGSAFGLVRFTIASMIDHPPDRDRSLYENRNDDFSQFVSELFAMFNASSIEEAVARIYAESTSASKLASLAPAFARDAETGVRYTKHILLGEMSYLAGAVWRHLDLYHEGTSRPTISLVGGLWDVSPKIREGFREEVEYRPEHLALTFIHPIDRPALGAARLAQQMI